MYGHLPALRTHAGVHVRDDLVHARTELEFRQGVNLKRLMFRGKGMTVDILEGLSHDQTTDRLIHIHVWIIPNANPSVGPVHVSDSALSDLQRLKQRAETLVKQIGCGQASLAVTMVSARTQLTVCQSRSFLDL